MHRYLLWLVVILPFLSSSAPAQEQSALQERGWVEIEQRPGQGERCLVCDQLITGMDIVELRYKGRVFFVAASMVPDFSADPDLFFKKLQASSALFDERAMEHAGMDPGWMLFGFYVLAGLVCGAACAYLAVGRGLTPAVWFFVGLVGNVVGLGVLLLVPRGEVDPGVQPGLTKVAVTASPLPCSACQAPNHPTATACLNCGHPLQPQASSEAARLRGAGQ